MFFISVDIDNYHDKCQIFISFKFKARFLHQSEKLSLIFLKINILIEKNVFLISACSNEWYCFKSRNRFVLPDNINNNILFCLLEMHIW